jgi:hypothetical protein
MGRLVLSLKIVPETLEISSCPGEKESSDCRKKRKTTRYRIRDFKGLKVVKRPVIFCSLCYYYKKINKKN